jgi:hypothetical protein
LSAGFCPRPSRLGLLFDFALRQGFADLDSLAFELVQCLLQLKVLFRPEFRQAAFGGWLLGFLFQAFASASSRAFSSESF